MPAFAAPPLSLLCTEPLRGALDHAASLFADHDDLPRGDGRPVIVYPGLGTTGRSTARLRATLQHLGWTVHDWPLGWNRGPRGHFDAFADTLLEHLERVADDAGRAPSLVGWSLGGVYACELARLAPRLVHRVVTLGSPLTGDPESTRAGPLYALLSGTLPRLDPALRERLLMPLGVPHVSIWSRDDGVVAWRACVASGPEATNVALDGVSHIGLVAHPKAIRGVARGLVGPASRRTRGRAAAQGRERPDSQRAQVSKPAAAARALAARQS